MFFQYTDILVLNETEVGGCLTGSGVDTCTEVSLPQAQVLTGCVVYDVETAKEAVRQLLARGPGCVVLTLGAGGVVFSGWDSDDHESLTHIPAEKVTPVDTTVSDPRGHYSK